MLVVWEDGQHEVYIVAKWRSVIQTFGNGLLIEDDVSDLSVCAGFWVERTATSATSPVSTLTVTSLSATTGLEC